MSATAFLVPVALVTMVGVGGASALHRKTKAPPFTSDAPGSVTCTGVTIKITFSPPLKLTSGGNTISAKGKLSSCTATDPAVTLTGAAKVTGSFSGTGTGAVGLAGPATSPENFTIKWKGKYNGGKAKYPISTVTENGDLPNPPQCGTNVGFALPYTGGTVTGSFQGSSTPLASYACSSESVNSITTLASGKKGLKKLVLTSGSITLP